MSLNARIVFVLASLLALFTVLWRAYVVPFNHDEVATFFHYVQNGELYPFFSEVDANNHFLNTLLTRFSFLVFGDHPFVLRLANVLSLPLLIFAVYRFCRILKEDVSRVVLTAVFLLSFYWLCFFAYCRGYGISMGFFVLSLSYFISYLTELRQRHFILFLVTLHLALSANLILVIPSLALISLVIVRQVAQKKLFTSYSIAAHFTSFLFIGFWLMYSVYLKKNGALYYGEGDSYWQVTFLTLSQLLTNIKGPAILLCIIAVISGLVLLLFNKVRRNIFEPAILFFILLVAHVAGFYLMKKLFGINFPEDRTGLFFFVFAFLFIAFALDQETGKLPKQIIGTFIVVPVVFHFFLNWNDNYNNVPNYELLPEKFYTRLLKEQEGSGNQITLSAYRMRQLTYAFMNYRNNGALNLMDPVEKMHTYSDYYIAEKKDSSFYSAYYEEIETDEVYGYRLLRRWKKSERQLLHTDSTSRILEGGGEYYNFFDSTDYRFSQGNPLLVQVDVKVEEASVPFKSWVVLEIQDEKGDRMHYKSWPFNWVKYDWNNSEKRTITLTTASVPLNSKRVICYLWNIRKLPLKMRCEAVRLYSLQGKGVGDRLD